jgi:uroporphyrin-III C-methyltransferase
MPLPELAHVRPGPQPGHVYLVGAGPGDPELLTLRGARLVAGADVVVYDNLVSPLIVDLASAAAERIYVGKKAADHTLPQEAINALLVRHARAGRRVVRLKGGDPFIFGRGGEEMEALMAAGITVEVVPGVTAAAGIAAYAGIPLTHRDHAQSVVFATGFLKDGALELDWPMLARPNQTLVIYMGISRLAEICARLVEHGLAASTPAGVIERGTTAAACGGGRPGRPGRTGCASRHPSASAHRGGRGGGAVPAPELVPAGGGCRGRTPAARRL